MDELIVGVNLFAICLALALVEVHIEGPHGWAAKLPTWRLDKPWIRNLTNGKPITGYHVYINFVILAFIHFPLVWSEWTLVGELRVLSQYFLIAVYWDFLWFVANPHFGLRRFKSSNIWWHRKWLFGMPMDYLVGTVLSAALWFAADRLEPGEGALLPLADWIGAEVLLPGAMTIGQWGQLLGVIVALTAVTALVVELMPKKPGNPNQPDAQPVHE
jgi:hypothetical protein